ncbi:c-type cytochrome biogenesis protein CcmI [Rhizobium sp. FKL33]|uniref:c-type cytochrome biogenesis protein CcmI n=1 Tax=Rhizobium sp. FKL33 TaxID=2562307 RepID=UPI0010C09C03|nr:c-type cytochrome biogenesis protein CcmI [Rhizobium sp. FKL33]
MFWIVSLPIAVIAALIVAAPLMRRPASALPASANDAEVYRDQLAEIDRDQAAGLIENDQAKQARTEIARRLIAASEKTDNGGAGLSRGAALGVILFLCLFLPAAAGLLYLRTGNPEFPDLPLAMRLNEADPDINVLIAKTEAHLAANPTDGRGWALIAPIYMRRMRADEAINAYRNAIRYQGGSAELYGALGEAIAAQNQGMVTKDAGAAFTEALKLDPSDARARFYLALAEGQLGDKAKAIADLEALAASAPKDAPWQEIVAAQIARFQAETSNPAAPGNPSAADVEAAAGLNDADRMQMIRTMVESLDARLTDEPANFEGWQRLIRSYMVLGDPEKAGEALKRGLAAFPADTDNGKALIALAREMGAPTEGATP